MKKKDLLKWSDWEVSKIFEILDLAIYIKNNPRYFANSLNGCSLAMIFRKNSTRTRVSFETSMTELGGNSIFLRWEETNFDISDIEFEIQYLSRNVALILARVLSHKILLEIQKASLVPVINGCCDTYHPCQVLSDILTIQLDSNKSLNEIKICYIGVYNNIANSLFNITSLLGIEFRMVTPIIDTNFQIDKEQDFFRSDLKTAIKDVDYIYTDTWLNMEFFSDETYKEEKIKRQKIMLPFQINSDLLKHTKAKVMHDMPIHDGYEITKEVVYSPRSIIFEQAANRLVTQKAIILKILEKI